MVSSYDIIKSPIRTEKGTFQAPLNKYYFWVSGNSNKIQIRNAVEIIYKVKVVDVNTLVVPGKSKRVRYIKGYTPNWKKAVVTLKQGFKIDLT